MTRTSVPSFPFANAFADARLDDIRKEVVKKRTDLIIDFREIRPSSPPKWIEQEGMLAEHVQGEFIPLRVRFVDVTIKYLLGEFTRLADVSPAHPARTLLGMLTWRLTGERPASYRLFNASPNADLWFSASSCNAEAEDSSASTPADFIRTHSPAPPLPEGLIPRYPALNRRFGGDPVTLHLGQRTYHRRLFVGSLDLQPNHRPEVDAVLNLGEEPSKWVVPPADTASGYDRWVEMGEGSAGMSVKALEAEATWVIERLRKHERVLVHCVAGFNRSVTVCTAVLILLEGLSAEEALARVREHHPWAKPDPIHWLRLKWLSQLHQKA